MVIEITIETRKLLDPNAIAPTILEAIAVELGMTFGLGDGPRDNLKVTAIADGETLSVNEFDNLTDWLKDDA